MAATPDAGLALRLVSSGPLRRRRARLPRPPWIPRPTGLLGHRRTMLEGATHRPWPCAPPASKACRRRQLSSPELPTPPCVRVRARRSRAHVHRHRRLTRCARAPLAPPMCAAAPATLLAAAVAFGRRQRKGRRKNEVGFREGGAFNWARPGSEGCFGPTNK